MYGVLIERKLGCASSQTTWPKLLYLRKERINQSSNHSQLQLHRMGYGAWRLIHWPSETRPTNLESYINNRASPSPCRSTWSPNLQTPYSPLRLVPLRRSFGSAERNERNILSGRGRLGLGPSRRRARIESGDGGRVILRVYNICALFSLCLMGMRVDDFIKLDYWYLYTTLRYPGLWDSSSLTLPGWNWHVRKFCGFKQHEVHLRDRLRAVFLIRFHCSLVRTFPTKA